MAAMLTVMAIAAVEDMEFESIDALTAFLNGEIEQSCIQSNLPKCIRSVRKHFASPQLNILQKIIYLTEIDRLYT